MGASLRAKRHENAPNTVEHHARKSQKNKAGHASSNTLSHLLSRGSGVRVPPGAPLQTFARHWISEFPSTTAFFNLSPFGSKRRSPILLQPLVAKRVPHVCRFLPLCSSGRGPTAPASSSWILRDRSTRSRGYAGSAEAVGV